MNIWKGLKHTVTVFTNGGQPIRRATPKKPKGITGRQWKKMRRAAREKLKAQEAQRAG